jgi:outer membrane immunogenic protein
MMRRLQCALLAVVAAIGFASIASAADMPAKAPVYRAAPVAMYNWTGFYLGVQGGYAWGSSVQFFSAAGGGTTDRYNINGGVFGGTLGYNWQIQQWVLGIEGDFSGSHISGSTITTPTYGCGTGCSTNVKSFGTLRARLGYAWDNVLLYGTGGWAYGNIESNINGGTATNGRSGWTAGAGAEYGFNRNWSAKLEWIYVKFDSYQWTNATNANFACTGLNCSTDAKFSVIRAGLNYRF